ncbi:DNA internalization-related competence protein ComEC/Rec2 [Microvenator marinus]|uniref:DNA internalization-related competence protein ComEC/Rec2 n=1 Tax=Microvenator marinus TaxID=2600177 RepID=A0A5B8XVM2_9DELT|nr:DNA internalization-related competence protein ComEC/Rec2 [Microvenator marinus]QED28978.1 DNA internalization-related competence protein ComEC/Rec2 [Microvenator marinus]
MRWYSMPWVQFCAAWVFSSVVFVRMPPGPDYAWVASALAITALGAACRVEKVRQLAPAFVGILGAMISLNLADQRDVGAAPVRSMLHQKWETCLEGEINGQVRQTAYGYVANLRDQHGEWRLVFRSDETGEIHTHEGPEPGMRVRACGVMQDFLRPSTPWATDYRALMHRRGVVGRGVIKEWVALSDQPGPLDLFARVISARRFDTERRIVNSLESPWAGLVVALTTGNKAWMDDRVMQAYADTGTSHILAISGLHFGVVAGLAWFVFVGLIRRSTILSRRVGAKPLAAAFVCLACLSYVVFVGAPVSAQRASVGVFMLGAASLRIRKICPFHLIGSAALLVLVLEPTASMDIGFQLSFCATFGILLFNHYRPSFLESRRLDTKPTKRLKAFGLFVGISLAASVATLAPLVAHFGFFSWWSIPLNLVVVPLVGSLVFPLMLVGQALSSIWPLGGAWLMGFSVHPLVLGVEPLLAAARMSSWNWVPGALPLGPTLLLTAGAAILLVSRCRWPALLLAAFTFSIGAWVSNQVHRVEHVNIDFLDVGQGDSALIRTPEFTMLIDAGGKLYGRDPGRAQVVPYLRQIGVEHLDVFMITHADLDHRGGAPAVIELMEVKALMIHEAEQDAFTQDLVELTRRYGGEILRLADTWEHRAGALKLVARAPPADLEHKNDRSIVIEAQAYDFRVLLTGDLEFAGESWWVLEHASRFDFLKMPHHGSHTSSSNALLDAVFPRAAMSSAGVNNAFSHPRPQVLLRYWLRGVQDFHTHQSGTLRLVMEPQRLSVLHGGETQSTDHLGKIDTWTDFLKAESTEHGLHEGVAVEQGAGGGHVHAF